MTNADKIRKMSNEELLEWLVDKVDFVCMAYGTERCRKCESCRSCWKGWLADELNTNKDKDKNTSTEDGKMENERQDFFFVWTDRENWGTHITRNYIPKAYEKRGLGFCESAVTFIDQDESFENLEEAVRTLYNLGIDALRVRSEEGGLKVLAKEPNPLLFRCLCKGEVAQFRCVEITTNLKEYMR